MSQLKQYVASHPALCQGRAPWEGHPYVDDCADEGAVDERRRRRTASARFPSAPALQTRRPSRSSSGSSSEDDRLARLPWRKSVRIANALARRPRLPSKGTSGSSTGEDELTALPEQSVHELLDCKCYHLSRSAWDAALFIGHNSFRKEGTLLLALGVLFNVLLQLCFIRIITCEEFSDLELDELDSARRWRLHYGHSIEYADPMTGTSLVSRVCAEDTALYMSTKQQTMVKNMVRYNGDLIGSIPLLGAVLGTLKVGISLTCCAVALFTVAVTAELRDVASFVGGVWALRRSSSTRFRFIDGKLVFASISTSRFAMGCCIAVARATVAIVLLYSGSRWLVKTVSLEELILNAVALAFILEIDEMVYTTLSPHRLDNLLDQLEPLACSDQYLIQHLRPVFLIVALCLACSTIFLDLNLVLHHQQEVREAMCNGNRDFVFGLDAVGSLHYSVTPRFESEGQDTLDDHVLQARETIVGELIKIDKLLAKNLWPNATGRASISAVKRALDEPLLEKSSHASCADSNASFKRAMYLSTGNASVNTCADAGPYCEFVISSAARLYCPETCGCDSAVSGLARRMPEDGCPAACQERSWSALREMDCIDWPLERLRASEGWRRLFLGLRQMIEDFTHRPVPDWTDAHLGTIDCPGMFRWMANQTVAFRDSGYHSGSPLSLVCGRGVVGFCPQTCWCANRSMRAWFMDHVEEVARPFFEQQCPSSCKAKLQ